MGMQTIDHGIRKAWCTGGALRSMLAVCMDDDRIRPRWLEDSPVVRKDFPEVQIHCCFAATRMED